MNNINKSVLVTPADIEANITSEHYFTAWDGVLMTLPEDMFRDIQKLGGPGPKECLPLRALTFCVLVLRNGHTVAGESHCQDPDKFDAQIGRNEARKDAINKFWPMAVYAARQNQIAEKP